MPDEFEAGQHADEGSQPPCTEAADEPSRTSAHTGGPECDPCRSELRARGVQWWITCVDHGIWDCPICHKHPGQCDFGSCVEAATTLVTSAVTKEIRRMCKGCAERAAQTGWTPVDEKPGSASATDDAMAKPADQPELSL